MKEVKLEELVMKPENLEVFTTYPAEGI